VRLAVGGGELPAGAQERAAVLELVAELGQVLDTVVGGDRPGDVRADGGGALVVEPVGQLGADPPGQLDEDLPLGAGLADPRARDLQAEDDAPLGGGLGDTAGDLVAGRRGQQHHRVGRVHQHLAGQHDVGVDAQRHPSQRPPAPVRVRQHLQEVARGVRKSGRCL
jgi:hypothetical protein